MPDPKDLQCPFCSAPVEPRQQFCGYCGAYIPKPELASERNARIAALVRTMNRRMAMHKAVWQMVLAVFGLAALPLPFIMVLRTWRAWETSQPAFVGFVVLALFFVSWFWNGGTVKAVDEHFAKAIEPQILAFLRQEEIPVEDFVILARNVLHAQSALYKRLPRVVLDTYAPV